MTRTEPGTLKVPPRHIYSSYLSHFNDNTWYLVRCAPVQSAPILSQMAFMAVFGSGHLKPTNTNPGTVNPAASDVHTNYKVGLRRNLLQEHAPPSLF